ncbi:MAG: RsmB/NOP family class I SAM-dependent RNA methyltransferase [Halobacteriales archaeon]
MAVLDRYEPLVDDFEAFRAACDRPLPRCVRVNTIKTTVERATDALDVAGVEWSRRDWHPRLLELDTEAPGRTWPYFTGWIHGQEEVSALPAMMLDPQPGERIWDAAAAPGSKASQLAALMGDTGRLVANDASLGRLAPLRSNLARLGVTNAAVSRQDARVFSLQPFDGAEFDRTLVDAPCSGEGTVRKNRQVLEDWSEDYLADAAELQAGILRRAVEATRSSGTVVYATCTFAPEENEAVIDRVISEVDATPVPFECPLAADPGVTEWRGETYDPSVAHARRLWPHLNDTGGFFLAKLEVGA